MYHRAALLTQNFGWKDKRLRSYLQYVNVIRPYFSFLAHNGVVEHIVFVFSDLISLSWRIQDKTRCEVNSYSSIGSMYASMYPSIYVSIESKGINPSIHHSIIDSIHASLIAIIS